jgi:hypothetical protein
MNSESSKPTNVGSNDQLGPVPEGCTPADAAMLRRANHALADETHMLQEALAYLYGQLKLFVETNGDADFYTGRALAVLTKTRPLEYHWPFHSPTADEAISKMLTARTEQRTTRDKCMAEWKKPGGLLDGPFA